MINFRINSNVFNLRSSAIVEYKGSILLQREKNKDEWSIPGGRVEWSESSEDAVVREFMEEMGITIKVSKVIAIAENKFQRQDLLHHEIVFYYLATPDKKTESKNLMGNIRCIDGSDLEFRWLSKNTISKLTLFPEFIKELLVKNLTEIKHIVR